LAFLLLIILPFGAGLLILNIAYENQIQRRRQAENEARLISMQETITNMHLELNRMLIQMRLDNTLSPNVIRRNSYRTMMAMLQLRRYAATSSILHMIAVTETSHGMLLSNVSSDNPMHFIERNFTIDDEKMSEFWYVLESAKDTTIAEPIKTVPSHITRGNVLIYSAILQENRVLYSPRLVMFIDAADIESRFADALPMESAGLVVTNREGSVLFSAGALPSAFSFQPTFLPGQAYDITRYGYMLTHSIASNGWHYYMFLPTADLLHEVREVARLYGLFGVAFAAASVLFFSLYYKGYLSLVRKTVSIQKELDESYLLSRLSRAFSPLERKNAHEVGSNIPVHGRCCSKSRLLHSLILQGVTRCYAYL